MISHHIALLALMLHAAVGEDSFCGNKCSGPGIATTRSCHCDKACAHYGDCCSDSKYLDANSTRKEISCKRDTSVVSSCVQEWSGPEFIDKNCRSAEISDVDPVGSSPVTSEVTGVTYNNYFCAICNGDAEKLAVWTIKVSCPLLSAKLPTDKEEAFKYIFYNHPTKEWGYVLRDEDTKKMSFHGCGLTSEPPEKHRSKVRGCSSEGIGRCDRDWKADLIRGMCEDGYTDPVYSNGTKYKNFYCAVCSRVDQSGITCGDAMGPRSNGQPESDDRNNLSFSLLLDINFSEGNMVGKRLAAASCLKGEIFDPFARRCRNIVCGIPGYVLVNGMCMAERDVPV